MANSIELFTKENTVGVFRGFREGGLEFQADLVLPYRNEFQSIPMHGQFLLVQLETPTEAVLGRIASFSSEGKLSFGSGEEFNIRALRENREVPEDLREQYLKYKVTIRVLGVLRQLHSSLTFVASHRRLPHVGSPVAFPAPALLQEIAGHNLDGAPLGHFALGEYIYAGSSSHLRAEEWMQVKEPEVLVKFPISNLVSRRSFVFARAGFGKSNLNKLLFSTLYRTTPTVRKRGDRDVPVGTVIFDPDGEYFWPDDKGRPGLCDVPWLTDKVVVFTSRKSRSAFYQSFVAGGIRLDIRRLKPSDVIAIALGAERQEQQNVRKLRGLDPSRWERLVNLIDGAGNQADLADVAHLLDLDPTRQEAEAVAARSNMTAIVRMLHDKSSQLMDLLLEALSQGKLCVVDVSQMRGAQSLVLSGLILRRIFDRNQHEFTEAEPRTIPTIAVVEEAQSVLNERSQASEPYVAWVKEGRKYDLGAVLITQQPGSIPVEILSQGDNWFLFHLLSASDLMTLRKANAHFSDDLLSALLNEPIPGQGVFWSSVGGKPYPVSIRALLFEDLVRPIDLAYSKPAAATFATDLRERFEKELRGAFTAVVKEHESGTTTQPTSADRPVLDDNVPESAETQTDVLGTFEARAIAAFRNNADLRSRLQTSGVAWGELKGFLAEQLPASLDEKDNVAYRLVKKAMEEVFGRQNDAWHTEKRPGKRNNEITVVKLGKA